MRSHIDACYARVAVAAANQANRTGALDAPVQGLYDAAAQEIKQININVIALESPSVRTEKQVHWMRPKDLVPDTLSNKKVWQTWRADVEDYIETLEVGMKNGAENDRRHLGDGFSVR